MERKKRFTLRRIINNDKSLIIFVLILAVIIWIVTSLNMGTDEQKTITVDVPISMSDKLSKQMGMQYYSLKDSVSVNVTVSGAKYVIGQVTANDLKIKFDTSNVNRAGEQSIPILVTNKSKSKDFTITSTSPSTIDAYFDVNETKTFDVELSYDEDAVADGYVFGTPLLSDDKVVISGPTTYVDKIDAVGIEVPFEKDAALKEPYNAECKLILKGSGIEQSYLDITSKTDSSKELSEISVTLPVLKEKTLPVEVAFDNMPKGLTSKDLEVEYSVDSIRAGFLDSTDVKSAVIGRIDFNELTVGVNRFEFNISNAQGFTLLDDDVDDIEVKVTVSEENFEKKVVAVNPYNVKVSGGKGGEAVSKLSKSTIIIIAPKNTEITASDVTLKCDISQKNDDNIYPLEITVSNNSAWVYSTYTATIEK